MTFILSFILLILSLCTSYLLSVVGVYAHVTLVDPGPVVHLAERVGDDLQVHLAQDARVLGVRLGELAPADSGGRLAREVFALAGQAGRPDVLYM